MFPPSTLRLCAFLASVPLFANDPTPVDQFFVAEGLEATVWAESPLFNNPTNMDTDAQGRLWVTEAVNYRSFRNREDMNLWREQGDRVMVLEDTDGDGKADASHLFVRDADLVAPMGISVIDNRVIVTCSPNVIVYTDFNRNARFDANVDTKEILLTGFGGFDHDHSLYTVKAGPDGDLYFTTGNAGPHIVTDRSGWALRSGSSYRGGPPPINPMWRDWYPMMGACTSGDSRYVFDLMGRKCAWWGTTFEIRTSCASIPSPMFFKTTTTIPYPVASHG